MTTAAPAWSRACLALDLLAANPKELRGMTIRARSGPVRDTFLAALARLPGPIGKLHPSMGHDALLGGLDLTRTLAEGRMITTPGLLDRPGTLILTMAERCPPDLAAILAARLDGNADLTLILLDESADDGEGVPQTLTDRLAFLVDLEGIGRLEAPPPPAAPLITGAAPRAHKDAIPVLTTLAARFGITSLRLPLFALRTALTHAALCGADTVTEDDLSRAAELIYAPRATRLPDPDPSEAPPPDPAETTKSPSNSDVFPDDMLVDAVRALVPEDILDRIPVTKGSKSFGQGAGGKTKGNRRGRPKPARQGRLGGSERLDLVATLRAAAPWQTLRRKAPDGPIRIHPSDIRLKRFETQSDRLVIFAVDASGSAAMARLAEAKGAVELMLARAYAKRDHVALIAFRGDTSDLLLPPTRSLVQTKRRLAALPGGGGTPLARGLQSAGELAQKSRAQGLTPMLALLTDGRANIDLAGRANRQQASEDATRMARWLRASAVHSIVLDVGKRPQGALASLAREMDSTYLPLPRADAHGMSDALGKVLDNGLGA